MKDKLQSIKEEALAQIEQAGAVRAVQSEKIQERAVLPESERIARIVGRRFVVAR